MCLWQSLSPHPAMSASPAAGRCALDFTFATLRFAPWKMGRVEMSAGGKQSAPLKIRAAADLIL